MNLPDRPAIRHAYERAVVVLLNATNATEEEAEVFVDAMADLIFTTMKQYIEEEEQNATHNH